MKKLLLLTIALAGILTCRAQIKKDSVWTAAYEADVYKTCYDEVKVLISDSVFRRDYITYLIKRYKTELPNGIESIPTDSLTRMGNKFGKEYIYAHHIKIADVIAQYIPWTTDIEQILRDVILQKGFKTDPVNGNIYCDCYIKKLKAKYPDKIPLPPPNDVIETVDTQCKAELKH